jgi:hypothetical protein
MTMAREMAIDQRDGIGAAHRASRVGRARAALAARGCLV